ncbi:MAG: hypothetical protein ACTSUK_01480 [Promethearchaeota archaeon]
MKIEKDLLEKVQKALDNSNKTKEKIEQEIKLWQELRKSLKTLEGNEIKIIQIITNLQKVSTTQMDTLKEIYSLIKELKIQVPVNYLRHLQKEIKEYKIEGRFPNFNIKKILKIQIDLSKMQAKIGTKYCSQIVREISVKVVALKIKEEAHRLFNRPFDPQKFLEILYHAYLLALTEENKAFGNGVSMFTIHKFVFLLKQRESFFKKGKPFESYLVDQFAVDLGKLLESGKFKTLDGYSLKLHPVRDYKRALFVIDFGRGAGQNYGLLSFKKQN